MHVNRIWRLAPGRRGGHDFETPPPAFSGRAKTILETTGI
jgi:hypothetical protein